MRRNSGVSIIARALRHTERTAVVDSEGSFSYNNLLNASSDVATALLAGREDLQDERIAFAVTPGFPWVAVLWGVWRAGGVAVPLPLNSARPELEYFVDDSGASTLVYDALTTPQLTPIAATRGIRSMPYEQLRACQSAELPDLTLQLTGERRAMILYTSGTSSRPKGVVTTHANITAQILSLVEAWEWSADDRIVLCLPLHHVHGIINVVCCALWAGATCHMLPRFDADAVWDCISGESVTLYGSANHLREAHRGLRSSVSGAPRSPKPNLRQIAPHGVWVGGAAREHAPAMEANQRSHVA